MYNIDWLQAIDLYNSGEDAIIFISVPWCPFCQSDIMPISIAAAETGVPIYYLDIEEYDRASFSLIENEDGTYDIEKEDGEEGYEEFLQLLIDHIDMGDMEIPPYKTLTKEDGTVIKTDYRYVAVPMLLKFSDGNITMFLADNDIYDNVDGLQEEELEKIVPLYEEFMKSE